MKTKKAVAESSKTLITIVAIAAVVGLIPAKNNHQAAAIGQPISPMITNITTGGVGFVTHQVGPNGMDASVGRWDTPYPGGKNGPKIPGLEPSGASVLILDINVNDGGNLSFDYYFETYDAGAYDWLDITLVTNASRVTIGKRHVGNPANSYGDFWISPIIPIQINLAPYKNQHVQLVVSVQQDGWGDQSAAQIRSLDFRSCPVAPLTPLPDDPTTQSLEAGFVDTEHMVPALQTALADFHTRVINAGGSFHVSSAYRTPAYQSHLREVFEKWHILHDTQPNNTACSDLFDIINDEYTYHGLSASSTTPASPSGPHTQGLAFDATIGGLSNAQKDALARASGIWRRLPVVDPVHYELLPAH